MAGSKNEYSGGASGKALRNEQEAKGLGTAGPGHQTTEDADAAFKSAPVRTDAPVVSGIEVNNKSHGTDSHVGAAGADGNIEVSGGAPTSKLA
ncbi:hypothetical protein E3Q18_00155 [Wallemia mellicola]|uniref:Uncharacterized protein n=1 Tax=Wallemia mellicola TaxID=1708541 RepID=A0A4T0RBB3_9BASI|nr:hypothetical protein E3Q24_00449 [Wallemia mellicola]TIC03723.1 hypothetical protein E3Q18_00155 [Wallemia mellicola]TIC34711.1 hypothetical protein E3Q10_00158 [Wallemia mellicola]